MLDNDCWFLRAKVKGLLMEWLMDSGANPNLLSIKMYEKILEKERPRLLPVHTRLVAANGDNIVTYGQTTVNIF